MLAQGQSSSAKRRGLVVDAGSWLIFKKKKERKEGSTRCNFLSDQKALKRKRSHFKLVKTTSHNEDIIAIDIYSLSNDFHKAETR